MSINPLVSIITPSYNQSTFLEQTILSVLKQDYEPIEYIIVDGASTDGSLNIIKRYADRLTWWVSEPDAGQAEAINKGLIRAEGEIVAWLNSDDLYMPCAVSRAVNALQQNRELGMVYGDALSIDTNGKPINKITFGDWNLRELIRFRIICQPTVFMRRSVLERAGYLDTSYHFMLDHHLWIRIAQLAPMLYINHRNDQAQGTDMRIFNRKLHGFSPVAAARYHPTAKNVTRATDFGGETMQILDWMQKQPDLALLLAQDQNRVRGGAYRLNGRYLLEGGLPWPALKSYTQALINWPGYTLKHWHRIIFAILCLIKIEGLTISFRQYSSIRRRKLLTAELRQYRPIAMCQKDSSNTDIYNLENWPGLDLYL